MKRLRWEPIALAAGLFVLVALAVANYESTRGAGSTYSTYDTGPNGYRALYEVLLRERVPVRRFEREIGLMDHDVRTLVISSWQLQPEFALGSPIDRNDRTRLQRFVRNGGRLIVLDDVATSMLTEFGLERGRIYAQAPDLRPVIPSLAVLDHVSRVEGTVRVLYRFSAQPAAIPLLGAQRGIGALDRPYGKGRVVVITAPDMFSNAHIAQADNARFAYQLLAGHGPVAFDERVHGYAEDKSFWAALPMPVKVAVWVVVAILILALIEGNVRFAPAVAAEPPDERNSSAYIDSMASLLARAHAGKAVIARLADDAVQRARRRASRRDGVTDALNELESLRELERPASGDLLRAAQLNIKLRKDLA
jgi:hypothetical protein